MNPDPLTMARFRLQWALDPVLFARDVLDFECDDAQAAFLRSPANQLILLCTRQWGKSTVTAIMAVWLALFRRDSLILIFSHTDKQAINLFRTHLMDQQNWFGNVNYPTATKNGNIVEFTLSFDMKKPG